LECGNYELVYNYELSVG